MRAGAPARGGSALDGSPRPPEGARARELLLAFLFALFFVAIGEGARGWLERRAPEGMQPIGVVADPHLVDMTALYGSFAREVAEGGGLLVHNHQTAEPHGPAQARPWDWFIGRLGRALELGPLGFFRLDRLLACTLFALALTFLLGEVVVSRTVRAFGVVAAFTGGSLYWVWELVGRDGPGAELLREWLRRMGDLSGLGFAFPVLLTGVPHLMLELVFFGAAAAFLLRSVRRESDLDALLAGVAILLQCSVRPYTVPVSLACAVVVLGREFMRADGERKRWLRRLAWALLPCLPLVAHYYSLVRGDTVFSSLDVYHPAPRLDEQLLFFGVPGFVALGLLLPGVRRRRSQLVSTPRALPWLFAGWASVNLLLVHGENYPAPFTVGWEVEAMLPLPFLALLLALLVADAFPRRTLLRVGAPLLLLHAVPSAFFVAEAARAAQDPGSALVLFDDERNALTRLADLRPPNALTSDAPPIVVLAHPDLAPFIPWLAGVRVYLGHPDHTPDAVTKRAHVEAFLADGRGLPALRERGVTHVLRGPRERALEGAEGLFDANAGAQLEPLFREGAVELFQVVP